MISSDCTDGNVRIVEPKETDILSGRGGGTNHHPGNEWYRQLIRRTRPLYRACPKFTKLYVSKAIVQIVQDNGGRFLEQKEKGSWYELSLDKAVHKTSQALRERSGAVGGCETLFFSNMKKIPSNVDQYIKATIDRVRAKEDKMWQSQESSCKKEHKEKSKIQNLKAAVVHNKALQGEMHPDDMLNHHIKAPMDDRATAKIDKPWQPQEFLCNEKGSRKNDLVQTLKTSISSNQRSVKHNYAVVSPHSIHSTDLEVLADAATTAVTDDSTTTTMAATDPRQIPAKVQSGTVVTPESASSSLLLTPGVVKRAESISNNESQLRLLGDSVFHNTMSLLLQQRRLQLMKLLYPTPTISNTLAAAKSSYQLLAPPDLTYDPFGVRPSTRKR